MAFYKLGERKYRPGVYMRFINRGAGSSEPAAMPDAPTPTPPDPPVAVGLLAVANGVLISSGQALSLGSGNAADGYAVVFGADINAAVRGETLVVTNPAGA